MAEVDLRPLDAYLAALNDHDPAAAVSVVSEEFQHYTLNAIYNKEATLFALKVLFRWLPDLRVERVSYSTDANGAIRSVVRSWGTQQGVVVGNVEPGREISWLSTDVAVVRDGLLASRLWDHWSDPDMNRRYGITPIASC